ncbi:MAG: SocA family protein [Labilibaculum sp.]|nr:SocA family protein [Labilibaculum sp.]
MSYPVLHIANKIIANTDSEHGELISNLKLQKLLYYMQGFHIAIFGKPLFSENVEAWQYGPVVREMYDHFKNFGAGSITLNEDDPVAKLNAEEEELFTEVFLEYNQFSAIKLMNMTHEEHPWRKTFNENPQGVISVELLNGYFKTQIVE